jgi:hypothetical protein
MHPTLKTRVSVELIVLWALGAGSVCLVSRRTPIVPMIFGTVSGVAVGVLQGRSIRGSASLFLNAGTGLAVRRALISTEDGRRAVQLQWVGTLILLAIAVGTGNPFGGLLAGFAMFACARDLVALHALVRLNRGENAVER